MTYLIPYTGAEQRPAAKHGPLRTILLEVCKLHKTTPAELSGESREARLVVARRAFIWRARKETAHSFPRIARMINKDHTTAVHQFYRVERGEVGIEPWKGRDRMKLFAREIEVVRLRAAGLGWKEIAAQFGVREITVRSYAAIAKRKMGERND